MSIARTNTNLAEFCKQVVGHPYWFGCFGQKASASLYSSKKAQYPSYYEWDKSTYMDDYGTRVCDCAGLIKWFLWSDSMSNKSPTYQASEDYGANEFYNKCTSKGKIGSLPAEKVGILVFKGSDNSKNHVGVIVDNSGTVVEAKGHTYGVVKSKASSWCYWGKCHLISYSSTPTPTPSKDTYTVANQTDPLRIHKEPTTDSEQIGWAEKGTSFTSTDIVKGENIHGCDVWVGYNGGYLSGYYLTPTPVLPDEKKGYSGEFPVCPSRGYFQRGDTGAEVVKLQKLLEWIVPGCLPKWGCDSDIGTETLTAVKEAQKVLNVKVDGFYGKNTESVAKAYRK